MKARFVGYGAILMGALLLVVVFNFCVLDTPPPSPALTAADLQEFRASLSKSPTRIPNVTNAEAGPRSACRESSVIG